MSFDTKIKKKKKGREKAVISVVRVWRDADEVLNKPLSFFFTDGTIGLIRDYVIGKVDRKWRAFSEYGPSPTFRLKVTCVIHFQT